MSVLELQQYTVHGGRRGQFIELFESEFLEPQEAAGMQIIGQFRDLDDPNRIAWLRAFPDMIARAQGLGTFYGSDAWMSNRDAANATMLDSDNVLLLAPTTPAAEFDASMRVGLVVANICYVERGLLPAFAQFFDDAMMPVVSAAGATVLGRYQTEFATNTFPTLPVREESVFVWFAGFANAAIFECYRENMGDAPDWRKDASSDLLRPFFRKPEVVRLAPTERSRLRA
jgi:NIPSNAP